MVTPQIEPDVISRWSQTPSFAVWSAVIVLAATGCLGIERELILLWRCWTTDPLRSIGMLIPPVSIFLTLRIWRQKRLRHAEAGGACFSSELMC